MPFIGYDFYKDCFLEYISLGNNGCIVSLTGIDLSVFENTNLDATTNILNNVYNNGCNFFDCGLNDSTDKIIPYTFYNNRKEIRIAIHCNSTNPVYLVEEIDKRLNNLLTDYIDVLILDNLSYVPTKGGSDGIYDELIKLQRNSVVQSIGFRTSNFDLLKEAFLSGYYDFIMFPFNIFTDKQILDFIELEKSSETKFISENPTANKKVVDIPLLSGFFNQYDSLITLWDCEEEETINQILYFASNPPEIDEKFVNDLNKLRNFNN